MKKLLISTLVLTLAACSAPKTQEVSKEETSKSTCKQLNVYNVGEYMDQDLLPKFEQEFNAQVNYKTFASNEEMYATVAAGEKYDILVPSDYMIQNLIGKDMIQKLDLSQLNNLDHFVDEVKNLAYDPDNSHSVPYFWGNVGIIYNKNNVDLEDLKSQGWSILKNPKYKGKLYLYDSERDSFMIALKALGYSMNTSDPKELEDAYNFLSEVVNTMEPVIVTDEVIDSMMQGLKDLAVVYSGDALNIHLENPDMEYFVPEEGTNIWADAFVIPKTSECADLAMDFIKFMSRDDVSKVNSEFTGYISPNKVVFEELNADEANHSVYSTVLRHNPKDEIFKHNDAVKKIISDYWTKIKIGGK